MLIPVAPRFRKRDELPKARRPSVAPPAGLTIINVTPGTAPGLLYVEFSAPISWNGVDVPYAFEAYTQDEVMEPCIYVNSVGANFVELEFNVPVDVGAAWQVNAAMAGITPAVAWPQSGVVS